MTRFILLASLAGFGALLGFTGQSPKAPTLAASDNPADFAISGPYTHENLSIFLLHGPDTLPPRNVLTLDEALAQGKAIVHETGQVNTLCVENLSNDSDLMMQNGDIVKGGRQDRVLRVAMILPPKSGPVAVESFCVEQGRWTNRGTESATRFAANPGQIAGKELKLAVNVAGQQGEVWKNVAVTQTALTMNNGTAVTANASPTSLQLATENKELQAKLAAYRVPLANIVEGKTGVVGYAIAVNGKVTGAEVYGSSVLMAKAWKKAINAAALEAFAEKKPAEYGMCKKGDVRVFLADAGSAKEGEAMSSNANPVNPERFARFQQAGEVAYLNFHEAIPARIPSPHPVNGEPVQQAVFMGRSGETRQTMLVAGGRGSQPDETRLRAFASQWSGMSPQQRATWQEEINRNLTPRQREMVANYLRSINATRDELPSPSTDVPIISLEALGGVVIRGRDRAQVEATVGAIAGLATDASTSTNYPQAAPAQPVQATPVQVNRVIGTNGVLVESRDRANPGVIIHRTFIAK